MKRTIGKRIETCLISVMLLLSLVLSGCRHTEQTQSSAGPTAERTVPQTTEPETTKPETTKPETTAAPTSTEAVSTSEPVIETIPDESAPMGEGPWDNEVYRALRERYGEFVLVTETASLNIREKPTTESRVIGTLPEYGAATNLKDSDTAGWLHVRSGSVSGYVSEALVIQGPAAYEIAIQAAKNTATVVTDGANIRAAASTDARILTVALRGIVFDILSKQDSFYEIAYNGGAAFVADICVEESGWTLQTATQIGGPVEPSSEPAQEPVTEPTVPPVTDAPPETSAPTPEGGASGMAPQEIVTGWNGRSVCIDAGHQAHGISEKEPNGPGSDVMKAKLTTGTSGCVTGVAEHVVNLQVALKLRDVLAARGYTVVMIRTTENCPLSNAERAIVSNESGADIFLRLHCNGVDNQSTTGVINYAPADGNPYMDADTVRKSIDLAKIEGNTMCAATGARNLGVLKENTMTGINWSKIPVTILEMGFMSNPEEDRLLASDSYQQKLAEGIADGVDQYFASH